MIEGLGVDNSELPRSKIDQAALTASESRRLGVELIDLCAKITGKFDPAMGAMIAYARDEALRDALRVKL